MGVRERERVWLRMCVFGWVGVGVRICMVVVCLRVFDSEASWVPFHYA